MRVYKIICMGLGYIVWIVFISDFYENFGNLLWKLESPWKVFNDPYFLFLKKPCEIIIEIYYWKKSFNKNYKKAQKSIKALQIKVEIRITFCNNKNFSKNQNSWLTRKKISNLPFNRIF